MKTMVKRQNVQREGVQTEGSFRIKATGKAFRILSSQLYSDRITAIIRELSCNAYDAHVEAGNLDRPFIVHLPTRLEPHFSLRDFGVGLSHDDVITIYTTYFESTKTNSNDYIGCLGLGSKSPFSYVDNFTIISYFNGEKLTYNAFMNEDGCPTIALMSTEKTSEPNGLEISFAVSQNDMQSFTWKAPNVFSYFKLLPKVHGNQIEIKRPKYGLKGEGWGIRESDGRARAIMGNVAYPLNDFDRNELDERQSAIVSSAVDIFFEIGDLETAASRESLHYNKATTRHIKQQLTRIVKEISEQISKELDAKDTLWEARKFAIELASNKYYSLRSIFQTKELRWRGKEIEGSLVQGVIPIEKIDAAKGLTILKFHQKSSYGGAVSRARADSIPVSDKAVFFYNDLHVGSHVRCKQVIRNGDAEIVFLIDGSEKSANKIMDYLGKPERVKPISSIVRDKIVRDSYRAGNYNPKNASKLLVYDPPDAVSSDNSSYWAKSKIDFRNGGIFVAIDRYRVSGNRPDEVINKYLSVLEFIDEDTEIKIIGVKTSMMDKVRDSSKWVSLSDYVKAKFEAYLVSEEIVDKVATFEVFDSFINMGYGYDKHDFVSHCRDWNPADASSPMGVFIKMVKDAEADRDLARKVRSFCQMFGIQLADSDKAIYTDEDFTEAFEKAREAYPMLKACQLFRLDSKVAEDYINMVDRIRAKKV